MSLVLDASMEDLKVFMEEADELLQLMDEDLIRLEQEPDNAQLLQEVFRAAHTLKGSSATIGHQKMASLTHAMENILDRLRGGDLVVDARITSALLAALDSLRVLESEIASLEESDIELDDVLSRLAQVSEPECFFPRLVATSDSCSAASTDLASSEGRGSLEAHFLAIKLRICDECPMPAARVLQVVMALSEACEIRSTEPCLEDIHDGKAGKLAQFVVSTPWDVARVRAAVSSVEEVESVEVSVADARSSNHAGSPKTVSEDNRQPHAGSGPPDGISQEDAGITKVKTPSSTRAAKTLRVEVDRLDALLNLAGELVIERTRLSQLSTSLEYTYADDPAMGHLSESSDRIGRITDRLQEQVMKSRMLPIENVFSRMPRAVRDLAVRLGKRVNLVVEGQDTELDRSVIEELGDPLLHLLRNAVDHGMEPPDDRLALGKPETGTIKLSAAHADNQVIVTVEDDGRGIDPQKVRAAAIERKVITQELSDKLSEDDVVKLVFAAGLSTSSEVSDVSGRGVGLDVVRTNIERLNGSVDVETVPGVGTKFIVRLPLTLAIIQALFVLIGDSAYAIPMASVIETLRVDEASIQSVRGREAITYRRMILPLFRVGSLLGLETRRGNSRHHSFVVAARAGSRQIGLVVDALLGEQDIVIKPLGPLLSDVQGISGATIMGDGRVVLILDVIGLVKAEAKA